MVFKWAYGVTTVITRSSDLLPKTLSSLKAGGFDNPSLFVDPGVGVFGNWWLALVELYLRDPRADRFAIFQDDLVCVRNLKSYLEHEWTSFQLKSPQQRYLNLYTFLNNEQVISGTPLGTWHESAQIGGSNSQRLQTGRGALALVFSREGLQTLLSSKSFVMKPDLSMGTSKEKCSVDGAVVNAMNLVGWREMVHNPSLVRHTGLLSALRSSQAKEPTACPFPSDATFPGEEFDAMEFLKKI